MAFHVIHSVNVASLQQNDAGKHLTKASNGRLWCVFADRPAGSIHALDRMAHGVGKPVWPTHLFKSNH